MNFSILHCTMYYKKKVTNEDCMIVEFPNEENRIATGYTEWLKAGDKKNIVNIIEKKKIITVYWPKEYEVEEASEFNVKISSLSWSQQPLRILEVGGKYISTTDFLYF